MQEEGWWMSVGVWCIKPTGLLIVGILLLFSFAILGHIFQLIKFSFIGVGFNSHLVHHTFNVFHLSI